MVQKDKIWKVAGIYLIILNFILLIIFSGFVIDSKIKDRHLEHSLIEVDFNHYDKNDKDMIIGDKEAPLTIVQYTDPESPFCKKFDKKIYEQLKDDYIETGKVKMVIKNYPMVDVHKNALVETEAVKCAEEQNQSEAMYDFVVDNKKTDLEDLEVCAEDLNLDIEKFNECMQSDRYIDEIKLEVEETKEEDITVFPTFIIGDTKQEGIKPYFLMRKTIDSELEKLE